MRHNWLLTGQSFKLRGLQACYSDLEMYQIFHIYLSNISKNIYIKYIKYIGQIYQIYQTRSQGGLRAPTSSWRPFGLLALRPCDPRVVDWIVCQPLASLLAVGQCVSRFFRYTGAEIIYSRSQDIPDISDQNLPRNMCPLKWGCQIPFCCASLVERKYICQIQLFQNITNYSKIFAFLKRVFSEEGLPNIFLLSGREKRYQSNISVPKYSKIFALVKSVSSEVGLPNTFLLCESGEEKRVTKSNGRRTFSCQKQPRFL